MELFEKIFSKSGCAIGCLGFLLFAIIVSLLSDACNHIEKGNNIDKYHEYLDDEKYEEAFYFAADNNIKATEVISYYITEGKVKTARKLCANGNEMYLYFHTFLSNLQTIYDDHGIEKVCLGLSLIPYPSPAKEYLSDECQRQWGKDYYEQSEIASENNRCIESFCRYLQTQGNEKDIAPVLEFLQPTKDGDSEVLRIKNKYLH